jgi:methyltransferase
MLEPPKRLQRLSVALPASFTRDIPHLREKTSRVGIVARALAIFRVDEAIIYDDGNDRISEKEGRLFQKLLAYQETPQYLRRELFARDPDLQFAGILPPLRLPSHPGIEKPRIGLVREALVIETGASSEVNAGFRSPVRVASRLKPSDRITVRLTRTEPRLQGELVDPSRLPIYWRFRVTRTDSTLGRLIRREKRDLTISTSRKGRNIREVARDVSIRWKSSERPIVLLGSPDQGVPEILSREGLDVKEECDFNLNTIPNQAVETVRMEEALLATLSVLNLLEEK